MVSSGWWKRGGGGLRRGPVEVIFQRAERAVPVARQRGQELLRHLHRRADRTRRRSPGSAVTRLAPASKARCLPHDAFLSSN